ncbi:ABC transporter ATP-binding protein [Enterovirga rhinocerotis]|uniref:Branched-chain amino acid transport system ATP-binding protein n=1 Tax=Enterovirga rhinocerotis TaxID=1339210 RepID=A0A4R7BJJ3_9HYPH|nr:ABC transporter ATP-binding protein [Enterovirga rhinocerotis]TDR85163.1 branched-chain amino acid transport system ATP-binding protein [Enterovirga rhinocerotis]
MTARERSGDILLQVEDLHVAYGTAHVVHGVSFTVRAGEFVVMLGRNGAGKTTILQAISGLIPKRAGRVGFAGDDISRASARDIVQAGLIQVLEGHRVFTSLSVEDNLLIGAAARSRTDLKATIEEIYEEFPEIADKRHQQASRLSGGQQQILAVAQGIVADPRLLMLDEPSGGLAPIVVDRILSFAAKLARSGVAVLLVEQLVEKALKHADYGYLLETGAIGGEGWAADLGDSDLIRRIYLGGHEAAP